MNWTIFLPRGRRKYFAVHFALILGCFVKCSGAQDFRIDNQVRIQANDCYTRIAIGSRMPDSAVTSTVPANSLSDCEVACSGNRTLCNAFSFGIDARGNGTCRIGRMDLNTRGNDLIMDPDYDVYERRAKMPRGCQHDRLLRIGFGVVNNTASSRQQVDPQGNGQGTTTTMMMMKNGAPNARPQNPFGNPFTTGSIPGNDSPRDPSFFRGGWYSPIADDSDSRLYDIINNKKNYKSNPWEQTHHHDESPHEHYSGDHNSGLHSHGQIHHEDEHNDYLYRSPSFGPGSSDNKWSFNGNSKWTGNFGMKWNAGFPGADGIQRGVSYPISTISPGLDSHGSFHADDALGFPKAMTTVDPLLEETKACYRKLLAGKRLAESHVRRNVQCSRIEECHRVCEYESTFVCEGFNYGRLQEGSPGVGRHGDRSYMCQLTSLSASRMDHRRDFVQDPRYDYYERDWRCPAEKPAHGGSDWSREPQRPPWNSFPARRPPNEISRPPQRPNDRYPSSPAPGSNPHYYLPEKPKPSISLPNDYGYYHGFQNYLPQRPQRPPNEVVHYHRPSQLPESPQALPYLPNRHYYYPASGPSRPGTYSKFPDRRVDQNRWPRPPLESRPNEIPPDRDWQRPHGQYLPHKDWPAPGVYGPSYGYDSNRYDGRFPDGQPPRRHEDFYPEDDKGRPSKPPRRPVDQQDYYGYHYGPAYGYEENGQHGQPIDSYVPSWKPQHPGQQWTGSADWGGSRDCSVRSATGFKVSRKIVDASYTTGNLEECEMLCASRPHCQSFAYRYSLAATAPTDNCLLSGISFSKLHFYTDLVPDRDYDIYAIISDLRNCQGSRKPTTEARPQHRPPEECFWRVRSGFGIPVSLTRKELRVENGLGECQVACVSARHFTCRSFVFRYESDRDRGPNCFLSDCPSSEIIPGEGVGLPRIDQAELYERGSYGRGCEPYPFTTIYNPSNYDKPKPWTGGNNHVGPNRGDENCYSGYQNGCRLSPYAVSSITRVDSETECRKKCSRMRNNPHSPCMSFSFKIGDEKRGDNCYLSDVPRKDLRPGLDYIHDDDYVMYAWKELEPQCSSGPVGYPPYGGSHGFYQDSGGSWPGGSSSDGRPPHLGPGNGFLSYNHLILGVRPLDPDRPDPPGPHDYSPPPHDDFSGSGSPYPDGFASFNRHYTVNGLPCKRGTKCERNQLVGFWSCEPEGSDLGSWDYCCEPNHHCGYSQGYRYPWCYVGPSEDQWRPCSDKYFPYLPSPRPAVRPNHQDHRRPPFQTPGGHVGYEDPSTYHSRHWPIAFLHPQPPPNTTDSVALADDRRDDPPTTNTSKHQPRDNATRAPSTEITNSPITHLQLHKSHLKRRGLVPANKTRPILPKNAVKKIRRITIIPADKNSEFATRAPPRGATYTTEKSSDFGESRAKTTRKNDAFEVIHLGATLPNVSGAKKRTGGLGRVERVTKPTRTTPGEDEKRGSNDEEEEQNSFDDFEPVFGSNDRRSSYVPVALKLHASNDSSREA